MPDLFGVAGGQQQATRDQDAHALASMQVQDTASVIQARGLGMQEESVKIESARMALNNQKLFQQKLQAMHSGGGGQQQGGQGGQGGQPAPLDTARTAITSMANDFLDMASVAMDSNMPEQGKDFALAATTMMKNQAQIEKVSIESQNKNRTLLEKLLPSVHDDASWKQGNMIFQMETGHPSPFADRPYDPNFVKQLQSSVQTAKDKALTDAAKARAFSDEARAKEAKLRTDVLIPTQAKLNESRTTALEKAGAKALIPKAADLKVITDIALQQYGGAGKGNVDASDAKSMAGLRVQARPIAERMNELMKENPGMSQVEAGKKAFTEANKRGDFAGLDKNPALPGASPKTAVKLPIDKTKAKDNHWYTVNGKPMYLDGGTLYNEEEMKANEKQADESVDEEEEDDE